MAEREREIAGQARRDGKAFLGEDRVRKQDPFGFPQTPHKKGKLSPTFAAGTPEGQKRARKTRNHFLSTYRDALQAWRKGIDAIFPAGTYGLVKLCKVCCAALETATPALDTG